MVIESPDAVAICATDLEIIYHGPPASIQGGKPFNKGFTPGHEYMGTVVALGPGVDEHKIGQRVTVEIHAGCGQCKRCREGMYTSCHNYGLNYGDVDKGHRANGFTTDGGFCEYQVNHINTLVAIPDDMTDEEQVDFTCRQGRIPFGVELFWRGIRFGHERGLPRLIQGSVAHLPFRDASFDVVLSFDAPNAWSTSVFVKKVSHVLG